MEESVSQFVERKERLKEGKSRQAEKRPNAGQGKSKKADPTEDEIRSQRRKVNQDSQKLVRSKEGIGVGEPGEKEERIEQRRMSAVQRLKED